MLLEETVRLDENGKTHVMDSHWFWPGKLGTPLLFEALQRA